MCGSGCLYLGVSPNSVSLDSVSPDSAEQPHVYIHNVIDAIALDKARR